MFDTPTASASESTGFDPFEVAQRASESGTFESLAPPIQVALFLGGMALITAMVVSMTSFTRIIIVLSFTRRALAAQEIPPNPVLIGLALFLTLFVMGSTLDDIDAHALRPWMAGDISAAEAAEAGWGDLRGFMMEHTRKSDLELFLALGNVNDVTAPDHVPARVLIPSFVVSELKTAFIMGFCIYIPFLLVDLVVSTILMSLGMMMMPPVVISTPFKILLFVLVDGWHVIARAVSLSFSV
ncbi:MAG: flagellar type III secretion system pore protein FliP [Planctomycetaceae bacterium]